MVSAAAISNAKGRTCFRIPLAFIGTSQVRSIARGQEAMMACLAARSLRLLGYACALAFSLAVAKPARAQVTGQTPPPLPPPPTDPAEAGQTANVPLRIGSATLTGSIQTDATQT